MASASKTSLTVSSRKQGKTEYARFVANTETRAEHEAGGPALLDERFQIEQMIAPAEHDRGEVRSVDGEGLVRRQYGDCAGTASCC